MKPIPELRIVNGVKQLFVDGELFRARSGELHNSSSSTAVYMEKKVWPSLRPLGLNTVVLPVAWEMIEPEQGKFDFSLVDALLEQGKREGVRYVFLWFGLWKNGRSTYVPGWVKRDYETYFLVRDRSQAPILTISPLCQAGVDADANAFAHLMAHLAEVDTDRVVITVQVENEMGILGAERDFGPQAEAIYQAPMSDEAAAFYGKKHWDELGEDAAEQFSVWAYAKAIECIASAGKAAYPLPMYVNAWLEQHPDRPGLFPSGGPVIKQLAPWRAFAPSIDFLAPDIYVKDFRATVDAFAADGNPLFIPEVRSSPDAIPFYLYAVAQHDARCFAPFGIDDLYTSEQNMDEDLLAALNIEAAAFRPDPRTWKMLASAYRQVAGMQETIDAARQDGRLHAFLEENDLGQVMHLKNFDVRINYHVNVGYGGSRPLPATDPRAGGFILELSDMEVLLVGTDVSFEFLPKLGSRDVIGYERIEEGAWTDENGWSCSRVRNGDEGSRANLGAFPTQLKVTLYRYR